MDTNSENDIYASDSVTHELGRLADQMKHDATDRGEFYVQACFRQLRDIRKKGRRIFLSWLRGHRDSLGDAVEKAFEAVQVPLARLSAQLDEIEENQRVRRNLGRREKEELVLEEDELSRMADEGGIAPPTPLTRADHARGAGAAASAAEAAVPRAPIASSLR